MPVAGLAGYPVRSSCVETEDLFGVGEVLGEILSQAQDDRDDGPIFKRG